MASITTTVATVAGLAAPMAYLVRRYRRDQADAWARLADVDRTTTETPRGRVEYAVRGSGPPLLVSHGIFHGCDGALLSVRDLQAGRRVIAPSRFGYLGSALPPDAAPSDQADAFVDLLDHLAIERSDVIGISAGATAALELARRHPDRVDHLVVVAGNLPGGTTAVAQPSWARVLYTDVAMWTIRTLLPRLMERLSGVPAGLDLGPDDRRFVAELVESLFPVRPRTAGIAQDAFVSNAAVNDIPLEEIRVPVLLVHAEDDPLASYDSAPRAAGRIPEAELLTLPTGGHLALGQTARVRERIQAFLARPAAVTLPDPEAVR